MNKKQLIVVVLSATIVAILVANLLSFVAQAHPKTYLIKLIDGSVVMWQGECVTEEGSIVCWKEVGGYPNPPDAVFNAVSMEVVK